MYKQKMNETDMLKLAEQDIFVQLYSALGVQGYSLIIDDVDGEYPIQGHDFTVSIYERVTGKAVAIRIPLEDARFYAERDETGLHFIPDYLESSTEEPEGTILFRESQQNGTMVYIWFDFEEKQFPVVLRVGDQETAFSSWTAAINHYRSRFGYRSLSDDERMEQIQAARQRYRECMTIFQSQRKGQSVDMG